MKFTLKTEYDILTVVGMQAGLSTLWQKDKLYTIYFNTITGRQVQHGEFETLDEAQRTMNEIWGLYREAVKMSEIEGTKEIVIDFNIT